MSTFIANLSRCADFDFAMAWSLLAVIMRAKVSFSAEELLLLWLLWLLLLLLKNPLLLPLLLEELGGVEAEAEAEAEEMRWRESGCCCCCCWKC